MRRCLLIILGLALTPGWRAWAEEPVLVRAAPLKGDPDWSPRQLFNAGLGAEERGNQTLAVQLFMAARLVQRQSYADDIYARGAGLRLVRILAGYDDDAAAAAALLVHKEAGERATDLAPLIKSLLRRLDTADAGHDLAYMTGVIASVRVQPGAPEATLEVKLDSDERRLVLADASVGPFSAGDTVRLLARRGTGRAAAGWRLVALSHVSAEGWQILAVAGLPGEAGPAYGSLARHGR